ncbi:transposase [Oscillatoria sp. CS-180]|uniref:transposase n=1 Tax=Oscillatoria sp. CS-180 TaxID=3021720 RepID=UPI00232F0ADA|nr:transposase [Oscillatoria sp. CS-180]MDB9527401.1 transposase [Oscillatoria sp. CS-180]
MDEMSSSERRPSGLCVGANGGTREVLIGNERERQTYYGALDLLSQRLLVQPHEKGNTTGTIEYLKFLQRQWPEYRLLILWDGASYHRSKELKAFLAPVNDGFEADAWNIHCVRFTPNDLRQNSIEDSWLQAKTWLRRMSGL